MAPVPIEDNFKLLCPPCSNIMVIGENQRFMAALITFKVVVDLAKGGVPTTELDPMAIKYFKDTLGVNIQTSVEACKNQKVYEHIEKCIAQTNKKSVSKAAHIKKFKLIPVDFSLPGGELTPTMKLKRKVTEGKYAKEIQEIYSV